MYALIIYVENDILHRYALQKKSRKSNLSKIVKIITRKNKISDGKNRFSDTRKIVTYSPLHTKCKYTLSQ